MAVNDGGVSVESARARIEAIRRAIIKEMESRLAKLDQSGGKLLSEKEALNNARRIRSQVLALLAEDGAPAVVSVAENKVAAAVDAAIGKGKAEIIKDTGAKSVAVSLDAHAKDSIANSVVGVLDEVAAVFKDAGKEIRRAIDVGVNTGSSLEGVTADVARAIDTSFSRAKVAVETAIRGAVRMALIQQSENASEATGVEMLYLYDGPEDSKTRPFCDKHVGKVYSLAKIKALANDDGLPVETFAGGYNCRHRLSPISREDAEAEGYRITG